MINIKQIRENYDFLTEKEDTEARKLVSLVRAGLFDAKKLPILKRALEKDSNKMTPAERKILIELLDSLMGEVLGSSQVYSKVKQNVGHKDRLDEAKADYLSKYDPRYEADLVEKDLPTVIILKRKAIRIFPGRQKVGLYYSQSLDRYVSIPFGPGVPNMNEEITQVDQAHSGNSEKKKKKNKNLDGYDAPTKPGQFSNLTKGWAKGDINTTEYLATKAGLAVGKLFRRKKQNVPAVKSSSTSSAPKPAPEQNNIKESFRMKLNERRQINELSASSAADTAAEVLVPGYSAYKEYKKGNYGKAALEAGIDVAATAAGALSGGIGYGAIKGARAASKVAKAAKAADTVSDASKVTKAAGASKGLSRGTKFQRFRAKTRNLGKRLGSVGDSGNDSQSQQDSYKKSLEPKDFSMKVNVAAPKGGSTAGYEKRADNKYRKSLEQPVSESIKLVAEGKLDSCNLNIENNSVTINTSLAKKIDSLYESLNITNKRKMKKMLNEGNIESFKKIVSFAVRQ